MGLIVISLIWLVNKSYAALTSSTSQSINTLLFHPPQSALSTGRVNSFTNTREIYIMEGERRKRKLENEEESEEEMMDKFFSLIRRTKDVRDLLAKEKQQDNSMKVEEEKLKGIWKPTFQAEDFLDFHISSSSTTSPAATSNNAQVIVVEKELQQATTTETPTAAPADQPKMKINEDKDKETDNLDLTLSL